MKLIFAAVLFTAACGGFDFDFDLDLAPGPITGDQGNVTFAFADGCPGADVLFGCPKTMPGFAPGSQAYFILGSTTGETDDEERVGKAWAKSSDRAIAVARRLDDGQLVLDAIAPGDAVIEVIEDGDTLDTVSVHIEPIEDLDAGGVYAPIHLVGTKFPVRVSAYGASRSLLFARGAITATTFNGSLIVEADNAGYFSGSDQVAVHSDTPGEGRIQFVAGEVTELRSLKIVTRDDIDELVITELDPQPGTNKATLAVTAKIAGTVVEGGPACDWRIVIGGPEVALSAAAGDAFTSALFVLYTSAIVYGSGDTIVECRANDRVVAQHTIQFAP